MYNTSRSPIIMSKDPVNNSTDIDTGIREIKITFNTDLRRNVYGKDEKVFSLGDLINLWDSDGKKVDIEVIYHTRVITVVILEEYLRMGEKYVLRVNERSKGQPGITSVEGIEMGVFEELTFFTKKDYSIKPPELNSPADRKQLKSPFVFEWNDVNLADTYEVQISKRSDMSNLVNDTPERFITKEEFDDTENKEIVRTSRYEVGDNTLKPNQYYWRVASWYMKGVEGGQRSKWSEVRTFYVEDERIISGVTPEDSFDEFPSSPFDPSEGFDDYVEIIESFPKEGESNLNTFARVIYFKVIGDFEEDDVEFEILGESLDGESEDHLTLSHSSMTIEDKGSYKLVSFVLDIIEEVGIPATEFLPPTITVPSVDDTLPLQVPDISEVLPDLEIS